jgi:hypothetical protein
MPSGPATIILIYLYTNILTYLYTACVQLSGRLIGRRQGERWCSREVLVRPVVPHLDAGRGWQRGRLDRACQQGILT